MLRSLRIVPKKIRQQTERWALRAAWDMAESEYKIRGDFEQNRHDLLACGGLVSSNAIHKSTRGKRCSRGFWSLNAHAEQEGPERSFIKNCTSIQTPNKSHHGKWRSSNSTSINVPYFSPHSKWVG